MFKKNGLFAPKKKIIKKPKFILELAVCLAICLIASSVLTVKYLEKRKESAIDLLYEEYSSNLENVRTSLRAYADVSGKTGPGYIKDPDRTIEDYRMDLEKAVYCFGMISGEYGAAYFEREKVMETPTGYYSLISFSKSSDKPQGVFLLEDASYIAPLATYKGGKYDAVENVKRIQSYRGESESFNNYARLGWTPKTYYLWWESIHINEETHHFLPGKATIRDYFSEEVIDEIDLTPQDTKGYTYVEVGGDYRMILHGYLDPKKAEEPLETMITKSAKGGGDEVMETIWPAWSFRTTETSYGDQSVYELLPITSRVMWIQDTLAAVLCALVISAIWYLRKKYIWRIFEYRKSTTEAMAHDLKTPLAAISMYAECMEEQPEKSTEYTGRIRENVNEMNQMLEKILSFSKSEGGEIKLSKTKVDMGKLIQETISKYADLFEKKHIEVKVSKEEDCVIETDEDLMRQTVENLLSNCAIYAEEESLVCVSVKHSKLQFKNRTSLSGISVDELKKPFVKGDSSRGEGGTGLGLAIVDNNLKILGYRLGLELDEGWFTANILL